MQHLSASVQQTAAFLQENGIHTPPTVGIILGTGLGKIKDQIQVIKTFAYQEVPHFVAATVEFHQGQLIYGTIGNQYVVAMQGRFHYYEGYSMQQITYPVRVMKALGVQALLVSNAAGGMNPSFKKGDLVLIEDHINLLPDNPLRGQSDPELGPRFPDMSRPYDPQLSVRLKAVAASLNIQLKEGIYVSVMGPNLETRAEYRWLRSMGADMVGMSTVPEIIVANQVGLKAAAVSVITDECDPDNLKPVDISEIIEVAGKADGKLSEVFTELIRTL